MEIDFDKLNGLVPAVVQEAATGELPMLGFRNREALAETLRTGSVTFYSRSRQKLRKKGENSGNTLRLVGLRVNCDGDPILARVELRGAGACHEGHRSCSFRRLESDGELTSVAEQVFDPTEVYGSSQS